MTLKVVYDTNVIVSAVWKPVSIPAALVALALHQQVKLCLSPAVFDEYREVLLRPKFRFRPKVVNTFLKDVRQVAVMVYPTQSVNVAVHEPDNRLLECAQTARAEYLVTGNKRHFPFSAFAETRIVSPAEFSRFVAEELSRL